MKSICYILIFLLLVLFLWNFLLKTKEPLDMNVNDELKCFDRHALTHAGMPPTPLQP